MSERGEPPVLRLADGRVVMRGGRVVNLAGDGTPIDPVDQAPLLVPQQPLSSPREFRAPTRRHMKDIPDTLRNANACAVVIAYTLYGLDDYELCTALNISDEQLTRIRESETYDHMHMACVGSVLEYETDNVRDVFRQHARTAASVLVDTLHNGTRGERTAAAKDFLDRSGHRPVDIVEHRHRMEGGLVIEVVKKNPAEQAPPIDMEIE